MLYAFISYAREDKNFADQLSGDLNKSSIQVWIDRRSIQPGKYLDRSIEDALRGRDITHVLVVLTPASSSSEPVRDEIALAQEERKDIIPLLLQDCQIPLPLIRRYWIDFRGSYDVALAELLGWLNKEKESKEYQKQPAIKVAIIRPTDQQIRAARDSNPQVRLIAGPGTGKSLAIEERVNWLLEQGAPPSSICVVSFTRAASRDLRSRIQKYTGARGQENGSRVSVTTLHSVALKLLRKARALNYPVSPQVLDEWELENIFDQEAKEELGIPTSRSKELRLAYEAFCSTGQWNPPSYIPPEKPITDAERTIFASFYNPTSQVYACVLPGEIVKKCVEKIGAGTLDPISLLGIRHLIVDEFQDLNPIDLTFIDEITNRGGVTFIAGDDDQSVYAFRYASPAGIQNYLQAYPQAGDHTLDECFRCSPNILAAARTLIEAHSTKARLPKRIFSQYENMGSRFAGQVHRWFFKSDTTEANAITQSCQELINSGMNPRDIVILISNRDVLIPKLRTAFEEFGVGLELPVGKKYIDTPPGRFVYTIIRIACDQDLRDYVAHRTLLGLISGVGIKACTGVKTKVLANNQNYLDLFYRDVPTGIFKPREITALNRCRNLLAEITKWNPDQTMKEHSDTIGLLIQGEFDASACAAWKEYVQSLPDGMNLEEMREYLSRDTDEQQAALLKDVYERLGLDIPEGGLLPPNIRLMTMHGVKGLGAHVVFIPGLEEGLLPSRKSQLYPGLIYEAARLLYVSITRASSACIMSYATGRYMYNSWVNNGESRFTSDLGGRFGYRDQGLNSQEAMAIFQTVQAINELG